MTDFAEDWATQMNIVAHPGVRFDSMNPRHQEAAALALEQSPTIFDLLTAWGVFRCEEHGQPVDAMMDRVSELLDGAESGR